MRQAHGAYRPSNVTLNKPLVMAAWWTVTRSMSLHCVVLGALLVVTNLTPALSIANSYELVLHWAPIWVWGIVIASLGVAWVFTKYMVCVVIGVCISLWFFLFAVAFFLAWVTSDTPTTVITGWATYLFLGWSWGIVTYVVWRDDIHVASELRDISVIHAEIDKIDREIEAHESGSE